MKWIQHMLICIIFVIKTIWIIHIMLTKTMIISTQYYKKFHTLKN